VPETRLLERLSAADRYSLLGDDFGWPWGYLRARWRGEPPAVSRAGQRAALPSSWRRAVVSMATSGTRLGSDKTVIRSVPA
jgi:hypothetical protein